MVKKNISWFFFFLLLLNFSWTISFAQEDFSQRYPKGSGARYDFQLQSGGQAEASLYVADVGKDNLDVEIYLKHQEIVKTEMWQLFQLLRKGGAPLSVVKGIFFVAELDNPEILPEDKMKGEEDVILSSFLIGSTDEIEKERLGEEVIEVPAGKIKSVHYKKSFKEKDIEFWLSPDAKPFGLVKLISKSKTGDAEKNYVMSLASLMKDVSPKIDPKKAKAISEKGRKLLQ